MARGVALRDGRELNHSKSASTNSAATKGRRSSGFSPMPMNRIGMGCSRAMAATEPPLAVPSSLVRMSPVSAEGLVEGLHLLHGVLPGVGVEDEPGLVRGRGIGLRDDALHLLDLLHQVQLRGQPAGGVREHDVDALGPRRLDGVEDHGGRIAPVLRDHGDVVARAPGHQLLAGRGAEGVAGGEQHARAPATGTMRASLPMVVVLPAPFTPASRITKGRGQLAQGLLERRDEGREGILQFLLELAAVLHRLSRAPLRRLSTRWVVAFTPTSASSSWDSSAS